MFWSPIDSRTRSFLESSRFPQNDDAKRPVQSLVTYPMFLDLCPCVGDPGGILPGVDP